MITYKKTDTYYEAYDDTKKVGSLELLSDVNDRVMLKYIEVKENYRCRGIATNLLRMALDDHPDLLINNRERTTTEDDGDDEDGTFLTDEGMRFVQCCVKKGVLKKNNILDSTRMHFPTEVKKEKEEEKKMTRNILDFFKKDDDKDPPKDDTDSNSKLILNFE